MSSICGIVARDRGAVAPAELVEAMLERMRPAIPCQVHSWSPTPSIRLARVTYGPDVVGVTSDGPPSLARAFSVGELYEGDESVDPAEIVLARYREKGLDGLVAKKWNGSFAAAIADPAAHELLLISDHTNSRPIYCAVLDEVLHFSTDILGLMALRDWAPDRLSCVFYLTSGFFVGGRTLAEGIGELPYAAVARWVDGQVKTSRYWRYRIEPRRGAGKRRLIEEWRGLLGTACRRRSGQDGVALAFSGGGDSRAILYAFDKGDRVPLFTYSSRSRESRFQKADWAVAEDLTRRLGIPLQAFQYDPSRFLQAMAQSVYHSGLAAGFVLENDVWARVRDELGARYVLWGDECMGWAVGPCPAGYEPIKVGINRLGAYSQIQALIHPDRRDELMTGSERLFDDILAGAPGRTRQDRIDELYHYERLAHMLHPKRHYQLRLGLFSRTPLLDMEIMDFVARLPGKHRMNKSLFAATVERMAPPETADVPHAQGHENTPYALFLRRAEESSRLLTRFLLEDNPLLGELLDLAAVKRLIQGVCRAPEGTSTRSRALSHRLPGWLYRPVWRLAQYLHPGRIKPISSTRLLMSVLSLGIGLRMLQHRFDPACLDEFVDLARTGELAPAGRG